MEFRHRDYRAEDAAHFIASVPAITHPLSAAESLRKPRISHSFVTEGLLMESASVNSPLEYDVAASKNGDFVDPLSEPVPDSLFSVDKDDMSHFDRPSLPVASDEAIKEAQKEWDAYKKLVLNKYSCANRISLTAASDIFSINAKGRTKSLKATHLEELDDVKPYEEQVKTVSEQEYIVRLRELNDEISQSWQQNDRVTALSLSVKVAKLLSDTSVPQFYPTLFILVTDILDTLGCLVWKRIKMKAEMDDDGNVVQLLPESFKCTDVPYEAKETCTNWFYKIGSVRELLPRIYLEAALLRCWHFLVESPLDVCVRLTSMARGLADPLASAYAHLYLARCASALVPETGYLISGLDDFLKLLRGILSGALSSSMMKTVGERKNFFRLVDPVIEWITSCIFKNANEEKMIQHLRTFGVQQNEWKSSHIIQPISAVVYHMLKQLPATIVGHHVLGLLKLIEISNDLSTPQYMNYRVLGFKICESQFSKEVCCTILADVMEAVTHYSELSVYLMVLDVYLEFILQNSMDGQLIMMLEDIFNHLNRVTLGDTELTALESILVKLISHFSCMSYVISLDHFIDILDALSGSTRISVYKQILIHVSRNNQLIKDPVLRQFLFDACKALHDSVELNNIDSHDSKQIAHLVKRFVQLVHFEHNYEQQQSFLVDCRAVFYNMDVIKETLVHSSNNLAIMSLKSGNLSELLYVTDFIKGCIAYNEVTIPSIRNTLTQLNLFLETAEIALQGGLILHMEDLITAAICCLEEIKNNKADNVAEEEHIIGLIQKLTAFLIVVPGHPSRGGIFLLKNIIMQLQSHFWLVSGLKYIQPLCAVIYAISALSQKQLPYHVKNEKVISNDYLYFGDPSYMDELKNISLELVKKISDCLTEASDVISLGNLALDACNCFLISFKASGDVIELCTRLLKIAASSSYTNSRYYQATSDFLVAISNH